MYQALHNGHAKLRESSMASRAVGLFEEFAAATRAATAERRGLSRRGAERGELAQLIEEFLRRAPIQPPS